MKRKIGVLKESQREKREEKAENVSNVSVYRR